MELELSAIVCALRAIGNMTETARLEVRSLKHTERLFIERARVEARRVKLSDALIRSLEEEGAEIVRAAFYKARPV